MDDVQCRGCEVPIAAVMLAAQCAQFVGHCYGCRQAYRNREATPARPCGTHMTYHGEILTAIVDGSPMPVSPWGAA
jgi:hypothetical protein